MRVKLDEVDGIVGAGRINKESVMLESTDRQLVKLNLNRIFEEKRHLFLAPGSIVVVDALDNYDAAWCISVQSCTAWTSRLSRWC